MARVASPLCAWVILKIAPPNVPVCVLTLPFLPFLALAAASAAGWAPVAVITLSVPCRASMIAFLGNCASCVSGTKSVPTLISTTPLTGARLNV